MYRNELHPMTVLSPPSFGTEIMEQQAAINDLLSELDDEVAYRHRSDELKKSVTDLMGQMAGNHIGIQGDLLSLQSSMRNGLISGDELEKMILQERVRSNFLINESIGMSRQMEFMFSQFTKLIEQIDASDPIASAGIDKMHANIYVIMEAIGKLSSVISAPGDEVASVVNSSAKLVAKSFDDSLEIQISAPFHRRSVSAIIEETEQEMQPLGTIKPSTSSSKISPSDSHTVILKTKKTDVGCQTFEYDGTFLRPSTPQISTPISFPCSNASSSPSISIPVSNSIPDLNQDTAVLDHQLDITSNTSTNPTDQITSAQTLIHSDNLHTKKQVPNRKSDNSNKRRKSLTSMSLKSANFMKKKEKESKKGITSEKDVSFISEISVPENHSFPSLRSQVENSLITDASKNVLQSVNISINEIPTTQLNSLPTQDPWREGRESAPKSAPAILVKGTDSIDY